MQSDDPMDNSDPEPLTSAPQAGLLPPDQPPFELDAPSKTPSVKDNAAAEPKKKVQRPRGRENQAVHLATSTFMSLLMVLALLLIVKWMVPAMVENIRYSWHRGQLRAEYDHSGQQLNHVSLKSIENVSELVSRRVGPTVVHIDILPKLLTRSQLKALAIIDPSAASNSQGSGFIISSDGYVLTNHHVVENNPRINVTLSDGRKVPAEIVGSDELTDLAVLHIDATGLMVADWGDSDQAIVGSPVWAIGSPFGFQHSVSFGIVSGKHRVDFGGNREVEDKLGGTTYGDLMQSDVVLHPGNSGGPLVNSSGQVVGVNAAILGESFQGISFSIPSKIAQRVASDIIASGSVRRGWLGIHMEDLASDERFVDGEVKPGVVIRGFPQGFPSPAREAGLRLNDIIVRFQEQDVMSFRDLRKMIALAEVGQSVEVVVLRQGKERTVHVTLGQNRMVIPSP